MKLTKIEMETIVNFNKEEDYAHVQTFEPKWSKKIIQWAKDFPTEFQILKDTNDGSVNFRCPKKWIKISPTKKVSQEQKEIMSKRFTQFHKDKQIQK